MTDPSTPSTSSSIFTRGFIPGLIVGLLIGLAVGAFWPALFGQPTIVTPNKAGAAHKVGRPETPTERDGQSSQEPGTPAIPSPVTPGADPTKPDPTKPDLSKPDPTRPDPTKP